MKVSRMRFWPWCAMKISGPLFWLGLRAQEWRQYRLALWLILLQMRLAETWVPESLRSQGLDVDRSEDAS